MAAFRGMHVSPAKHSSAGVTDGQTDGRTTDKVIPMCGYASQATQKCLECTSIPALPNGMLYSINFIYSITENAIVRHRCPQLQS